MNVLRIGSLFSCVGGLDLAVLSVLGGRVVWHAEIDPAGCKVLAARWPGVPNLGDVSGIDFANVEPVDVLAFGFPCTDVSLAGAGAGIGPGTRSGLWSEGARAVAVLRPSLVVIENVRGLLSARAASDVEPCPWCLGDRGGGLDGNLLCEHSEPFSAIWPSSGSMRSGSVYLRPRSAHATSGSGCSSSPGPDVMIPTPLASDAGVRGGTTGWGLRDWSRTLPLLGTPRCSDGIQHSLREDVGDPRGRLEDQVASLLPTPQARDGDHSSRSMSVPTATRRFAAGKRNLDDAIALLPTPTASRAGHNQSPSPGAARRPTLDSITHLLPTPRASDGEKGGPNQRGSSGDLMLPSAVLSLPPAGASTDLPSPGGRPSSDDQLPAPP